MPKIVIADVLYIQTDNTFYVLNQRHGNSSGTLPRTLEEAFGRLKEAGWSLGGKVHRSDNVLVDMMSDNFGNYIAVWEE